MVSNIYFLCGTVFLFLSAFNDAFLLHKLHGAERENGCEDKGVKYMK